MFMGRPGCGKGTQAALLMEVIKKLDPTRQLLTIETGAILRKFNQGPTYTAEIARKVMDAGGLLPEFMPILMWANTLAEQFKGDQHVFIDGSPRKLLEAQLLESALPFYGLDCHVIYLDVHHEESKKRLLLRGKTSGRKDDNEASIERRKAAYEKDTHPAVEYLQGRPNMHFHSVDGIGTIQEVHERIMKALDFPA